MTIRRLARVWFLLSSYWRSTDGFKVALSDELGCSPTLSRILGEENYFFDPLNLGTDENFSVFREAELKHGRVAMLAQTQILLTPLLQKVFPDIPDSVLYHRYQFVDIAKVVLVCAILEAYLVQQDPKDMPGDYNQGYFGVRDKGLNEEKLIVELENGRLAMVASIGFVVSDYLTQGQPWLSQWSDIVSKF